MVGIVVFLIITIVQFIVIAKGTERVAEVGARFTLDAMPGKQMSIDADLRAGHLTAEEARHRRGELAMESQLHGGMDGAMKFVKGDAIAGLIITMINILAGIVIGVTYHGMTAGDAANRFAILSVGDAMVSQIPSLLICVAAGVMITRVSDEHALSPKSLGDEITAQLTRSPRALYLAAGFLCGFALVPGFPWPVFLLLAAGLVVLGRRLAAQGATRAGEQGDAAPDPLGGLLREGAKARRGGATAIQDRGGAFTAPLAVTMAVGLGAQLRAEVLNEAFERERQQLQEQLGLPFPGIRLWTRATHADSEYEVLLHDVPYGRGVLVDGKLMLDGAAPAVSGATAGGPAGGLVATQWVPPGTAADVRLLQHEEVVARHAVRALHDQAHQFLGIQEVQWVLERVGAEYPGLVAEMQKVVTLQRVAEVLRRLLEEQLPIRNMRTICESLIVWGPKEKDALMLTEYVRGDLGRFLSHRATQGTGALSAVLLEPAVEKLIRDSIKPTPAGNYLALDPGHVGAISRRVRDMVGAEPRVGVAVITSMDIRRYVRRIVESDSKWLSVYSYQELGAQVRVEPLGRVAI